MGGGGAGDDVAHVGEELVHDEAVAVAGDVDAVFPADGGVTAIGHASGVSVAAERVGEDAAGADIAELVVLADAVHELADGGEL